ncbi:MAG: WD40 repeat domain-containing protein [Nitrososphaeria archaeon]
MDKLRNFLLVTILCILIVHPVLVTNAYSNEALWSKGITSFAPQRYRVSITNDQRMIVTNNGSVVVGLNSTNGGELLTYLPARVGDIIDGTVVHPSGKYITSIVNGSYIHIYNLTSSTGLIFNTNSTIKTIYVSSEYSAGELIIIYSTTTYKLVKIGVEITHGVSMKWIINLNTDVNALDMDASSFRLVCGLSNGSVLLINPLSGSIIAKRNLGAQIMSLKISSFGFFSSVTTSDHTFHILRTDNLNTMQSLTLGNAQGITCGISSNGEKTVVGLSNGTIIFYRYLLGELTRTTISSSPVYIESDEDLNYVAWSSYGKIGLAKFNGESLWNYTISSTSSDVAVTIAKDNPIFVVGCSKTSLSVLDRRPYATLTLAANQQVIGLGKNVTFTGQLDPHLVNQTIKIYSKGNQTSIWRLLGGNKTDALGRFKFLWETNITGTLDIKAVWEGNGDFRETYSTIKLDVREPLTVIVKAVTLDGKPISGIRVTVNGTKYTTNATGYVDVKTYEGTQVISVGDTQEIDENSRYQFKQWEVGESTQPKITIRIQSDTLLTAKYVVAYKVSFVTPEYFLIDTSPAGSDGWYEYGTSVEITPLAISSYNSSTLRILFVRWEGIGTGSYTGASKNMAIKVVSPIKEEIVWKRQFKLDLFTNPPSINTSEFKILPQTHGMWFDEGTKVSLTPPETILFEPNKRYVFSYWRNESGISYTRTLSITMDKARTVNATFRIQYYLAVSTDVGTVSGTGWYNASEKVTFRVLDLEVQLSTGVRKKFVNWSGNISSSAATDQIIMNGPAVAHANYVTQYYLNVTSPFSKIVTQYSSENPSGWYNDGTEVTFSIEAHRLERDFFSYYSFAGWAGDIESLDYIITVKMNSPTTINAVWKEELIYGNVALTVIPLVVLASILMFVFKKGWVNKLKEIVKSKMGGGEASETTSDTSQ